MKKQKPDLEGATPLAPQDSGSADNTDAVHSKPHTETGEFLVSTYECCEHWRDGCDRINAPITLQQIRNPAYKPVFKRFEFCPWCGHSRRAPLTSSLPQTPAAMTKGKEE